MNINTLSIDKLNYLNVGLMIFSVFAAYFYPFELFLIVFIFLGPLHYLTEISWLEKKDFYVKNRKSIYLLASIFLFICYIYFYPIPYIDFIFNSILFSTFMLAIAMILTSNLIYLILTFFASMAFVYFFKWHEQDWFLIIFTIFLPTIIHITIFTGLFMLSGVLKNKNTSGWVAFICFLVASFIFFILPFYNQNYHISNTAQTMYYEYTVLNKKFSDFFHFGQFNQMDDIFKSKEGVIIMQFIAFSYTYHYLNWFTKTSVIKWHEVSYLRMFFIISCYISVLGLIYFNRNLGISVLTLLSILHLIGEFPLNAHSFKALNSLRN